MPRRTDIQKVMVLGAGPIVIGQACEFDYSGTQGCRALKALGFGTYKLKFGHRGINVPVTDRLTGKVEITSQNHGFAVAAPDGGLRVERDEPVRWETEVGAAELSHVNLYDRTVEGLTLLDTPGATVQYHPEAGPGPNDSLYLFDRFLDQVRAHA